MASLSTSGVNTPTHNDVRVTPDGKISLPTIGNLKVRGLTLAEALIESEVQRYYRNVKSGLSLTSLRVFEVLVLGEVQRPGTYLATPVKRVSEVMAQAGAVLPGGSQRHVQVRRNGQMYATADLAAFLRRGDESANPFLHDGDVIFVPPHGRAACLGLHRRGLDRDGAFGWGLDREFDPIPCRTERGGNDWPP